MATSPRRPNQPRRVIYKPRYETPKTKRQWRISVFVRPVLYVLLLLGAVYIVIISPLFQIRKITVRGNNVVPTAEIQKEVDQALSETLLSRNILFLNAGHINDLVKSQN